MTIKIRGLSGQNTLTVQGQSLEFDAQPDPYPALHTRLMKTPAAVWGGFTFSLGGYGQTTYIPLEKPVFQMQFRVDDVSQDGHTVYVNQHGTSIRHPLVLGGTGIVSRKINGKDVVVRKAAVVDANWDQRQVDGFTSQDSIEAPLHSYYKHGDHRYFYALASVEEVDGELRYGPIQDIGSVTLPDSAGSSSAPLPDLWNERSSLVPGGSLAAPTDVMLEQLGDGSTVRASYTSNPAAYGTVIFRSEDPATLPNKSFIEFADDGEPIQIGDLIVIHNSITKITGDMKAARTYYDNSTHPFSWSEGNIKDAYNHGDVEATFHHFDEEPVAPPTDFDGNVYIQLVLPDGAGERLLLEKAYRTGTYHPPYYNYFHTGDSLRWKSWVYVDKAARIRINPGMSGVSSRTVDLAAGWTWVEEVFTVVETPEEMAGVRTVFAWNVFVESLEPGTLTTRFCGLRPHRDGEVESGFVQIVRDSIPAGVWVRNHKQAKEGYHAISAKSWTGPAYEGRSTNALFELCEESGSLPWVHIPTTRDDEFFTEVGAHFVDNWLDVFGTIRTEPGYEAWNSLGGGIVFSQVPGDLIHHPSGDRLTGGQSFGMIAGRIMDGLESVPGWPDAAQTVLGGWASRTFGPEAAEFFIHDHILTIAAYAQGWDSTTNVVSDNQNGYKVSVSVGAASRVPGDFALLNQQAEAIRQAQPNSNIEVATYEGGYGLQINGLMGASVTEGQNVRQEVVKHSIAAATGVLDTCLVGAVAGHKDTNLFTASVGTGFQMISCRVEGHKLTPMYQIAKIIQDEMGGPCHVLDSEVVRDTTQSVIGPNHLPATFSTTNVTALRPVDTPSKLIVIVRSRADMETALPVVMTTFSSAESARVYPMVGDLKWHNSSPVGLRRSGEPRVDGEGQTGNVLRLTSMGGNNHVGNTFTFRGQDATVYTVTGQEQVDPDTFDLTISPDLAVVPTNGRVTQWGDGLGWVPDDTCVDIDIAGDRIDLDGPLDLQRITVDETYGATAEGMLPGNSIVIVYEGVS